MTPNELLDQLGALIAPGDTIAASALATLRLQLARPAPSMHVVTPKLRAMDHVPKSFDIAGALARAASTSIETASQRTANSDRPVPELFRLERERAALLEGRRHALEAVDRAEAGRIDDQIRALDKLIAHAKISVQKQSEPAEGAEKIAATISRKIAELQQLSRSALFRGDVAAAARHGSAAHELHRKLGQLRSVV